MTEELERLSPVRHAIVTFGIIFHHPTPSLERRAAMIAYIHDVRTMIVLTLCTVPLLALLQSLRGGKVQQANHKLLNRHAMNGGPLGSRP